MGKNQQRKRDGTLDTKTIKEGDGNGFKMRTNVWTIRNGHGFGTRDAIAYQHPATFPEQLANDHIITWSNPGDLVLDPLAGSGTTLKMAKILGRQFIGIEISEEYCTIARKRIEMIGACKDGVTAA